MSVEPRVRKAAKRTEPAPAPPASLEITRKERKQAIVAAALKAGVYTDRPPLCCDCHETQVAYTRRRHRFLKVARAALVAGQSMDEAINAAAADARALCE